MGFLCIKTVFEALSQFELINLCMYFLCRNIFSLTEKGMNVCFETNIFPFLECILIGQVEIASI